MNSSHCPTSQKLAYTRVVTRYYDKMMHYEPIAKSVETTHNPLSPADREILALYGLDGKQFDDTEQHIINNLDRGTNFEWDKMPMVRSKLR